MGQLIETNPAGGDAATTQPGEGAALIEVVGGVIIATMPSADKKEEVPAPQQQ